MHWNKFLVGPVIEKHVTGDWMQGLVACATSNDCVSYNFQSRRSGTCGLLNEGIHLGGIVMAKNSSSTLMDGFFIRSLVREQGFNGAI